jgi:DNA-binding transcriptional MerR regulator
MYKENRLLSIGEIAKYTGVSIRSLRYYERINILKPAYVDPDSGYRYYSSNQAFLIELIMFCIELDIPLKELSAFLDRQDIMDFQAFLDYGKEVAHKKKKTIERGLKFIDFVEQTIATHKEYPFDTIYTRQLPEKHFCIMPYDQTYYGDDDYEWLDYGLLYEYSLDHVHRHAFIEVPQNKKNANCKVIPAGLYYCKQCDISQIEQAAEIFKDYLAGRDVFIAIETVVFFGKFNINKPINELRIIVL